MQGTKYIRGWGALLWLLPGCISLDGLIDRDAGQDAGDETELDPTDAGLWPDSETNPSEADAGGNVPPDDAALAPDADDPDPSDASVDTGALEPDPEDAGEDANWGGPYPIDASVDTGPVQPHPEGCTANNGCQAHEVCGPEAICMPRCTAYGACVVAQTARDISRVAADVDALYWALAPSQDALGNYRRDGELWRMLPGQAAERIADQLGDAQGQPTFAVHGGFVYFVRGRELHRRVVDASQPSAHVYTFPGSGQVSWKVGDGFVAVLSWEASDSSLLLGNSDGSGPLQPRWSATSPWGSLWGIAADGDRLYFVGAAANEGAYIKSLRPSDSATLTTHAERLDMSSSEPLGVYERRLLSMYRPGNSIRSFNLDDGETQGVARALTSQEGLPFLFRDWIYWYEGNAEHGTIVRYSLESVGTLQTIVARDADQSMSYPGLAVLGGQLYTVARRGGYPEFKYRLIYAMPLPPEPCAADLPCPSGKSCGSDALCH
ncbi:MAG TPA: hypothetical protein VFZ61_04085 [Polyangiales bacterium]